MITLPGGRFAVERVTDLPRLLRLMAVAFGPSAWRVLARSRDVPADGLDAAQREWARRVTERLGMRIETSGLEHVDPHRPYVVLPLHEGFADVLALSTLPVPLSWVARDELVEWPLLGRYLRGGNAIVISPERSAAALRSLMREAPSLIGRGRSLVVFGQGTLLGIETAIRRGPFALSTELGLPILPVVLAGTGRVYEYPFTPIVRFDRRVRMTVLQPVEPPFADEDRVQLQRAMKASALAGDPGPRRYRPEADGFWDGYAFEIDPAFHHVAEQVEAHRAREERRQGR